MTFRSRKRHRTTATALSSRTWTPVSRAAAALCALASVALAGPPERPILSPVPSANRSTQVSSGDGQSRYLSDLTQIKNATLESESVFFERLERQKKIEEIRVRTSSVAERLRSVRMDLSPAVIKSITPAADAIDRTGEPLGSAGKFIVAALAELRNYHEGSTAEAVAVAAGKTDAAQYAGKIRRLIRGAEQSLNQVSLHLAGPLSVRVATPPPIDSRNVQGAIDLIERAREELAKLLDSLGADDPQRADLLEADRALDEAFAVVVKSADQAAKLRGDLTAIRRDYLPECVAPAGPALAPPRQNSTVKLGASDDCQGASLAILQKSAPAIATLRVAATEPSKIAEETRQAKELVTTAIAQIETAESKRSPTFAKIKTMETEANELLRTVEISLSSMKRLLTEDVRGEAKQCTHCGKSYMRTRKVPDPACTCAKANAAMLDVEAALGQARALSLQMSELLGPPEELDTTPLGMARKKLRPDGDGIPAQLQLAKEDGEKFRNQEFDFYQGNSIPPEIEQVPPRSFPPMVATYVARQSWHYPLYFEDISAERYGHHFGCIQPVVSYGKFMFDLAMLPYNMCLDPPCTIQYDLGLYRPGDEVPHLIYIPRWDCKAALFEVGVWTGIMFTP